jgi:hypothetical protein
MLGSPGRSASGVRAPCGPFVCWCYDWPGRTVRGGTGASTVSCSSSVSRSPRPPYGRSSTKPASTQHPNAPRPPGGAFLRSRAEVILAADFFEVVTLTGQRMYVLAVIEHASRRVRVLGVTVHPTAAWITQGVRNLAMDLQDAGSRARFLIRDRDGKYPALFDTILNDTGITVVLTGVRMPRMNAIMEKVDPILPPRAARPNPDVEPNPSPARPAGIRTALQPPPAAPGHLQRPAAAPAPPADHRSRHHHAPAHPPTRPPRRRPTRIRTRRLKSMDEVFGTRSTTFDMTGRLSGRRGPVTIRHVRIAACCDV